MYNVIIVDDQSSSQALMQYAIMRSDGRYKLAKAFFDADRVLGELKYENIDLILMDIHTAGKENGIKAAKQIKEHYPQIKIIILTFALQKKHIDEAKNAGCEGFWYKDHADKDLLLVMDSVMEGKTYYPETQPVIKIGMAKIQDFTARELEILQAKVNGHSNEEVCTILNIKSRTLDTHLSNIKNKTGYNNLLKLVADVASKKFIIMGEDTNY